MQLIISSHSPTLARTWPIQLSTVEEYVKLFYELELNHKSLALGMGQSSYDSLDLSIYIFLRIAQWQGYRFLDFCCDISISNPQCTGARFAKKKVLCLLQHHGVRFFQITFVHYPTHPLDRRPSTYYPLPPVPQVIHRVSSDSATRYRRRPKNESHGVFGRRFSCCCSLLLFSVIEKSTRCCDVRCDGTVV